MLESVVILSFCLCRGRKLLRPFHNWQAWMGEFLHFGSASPLFSFILSTNGHLKIRKLSEIDFELTNKKEVNLKNKISAFVNR